MMLQINDLKRHNDSIRPELERAVSGVIESGWLALGPRVEAFEKAFAEHCGSSDSIGVANGTDALTLALLALGVGPGDEVVTAANAGMYATAAILGLGADPVFVDVDPHSLTIAPPSLETRLGPRTRAIVATHLYGRVAPLDRLLDVAGDVPLIEDCAQSHGASVGQRPVGSVGALGCFSFYPTKNLGACGDAGAVTTSDDVLAGRIRRLRQYGWAEKYRATEPLGRNSRLDEVQAAILLEKLPHLGAWNARGAAIARAYGNNIRNQRITLPPLGEGEVVHLYVVRSDDREALRMHLHRWDIDAQVHYPIPDHQQPAFASRFAQTRLPETERACCEVLTLPCFPEMTDEEVQRVIEACSSWGG